MTNFERIATSVPQNKTAAIVTSGGKSSDEPTAEQQRETLISVIKQLERDIKSARTDDIARHLGIRKQEIQDELRALKLILKPIRRGNIADHFMKSAKVMLPRHMFELIREAAYQSHDVEVAAETINP